MEEFFKKFPAVGYILLCGLLGIIIYMAQEGLKNNTRAMDRLSNTLDRVEASMGRHEVKLENHEVRLSKGGL